MDPRKCLVNFATFSSPPRQFYLDNNLTFPSNLNNINFAVFFSSPRLAGWFFLFHLETSTEQIIINARLQPFLERGAEAKNGHFCSKMVLKLIILHAKPNDEGADETNEPESVLLGENFRQKSS